VDIKNKENDMKITIGKESNWGTKQDITVKLLGEGLIFSNGFTIHDEHDQD
jgi:hypothetical protein